MPTRGESVGRTWTVALSAALILQAWTANMVRAESDRDARAQSYARTIDLLAGPVPSEDRWAEVTLDDEIRTRAAHDLRDVQIVDADGKALPQRFRSASAMDVHWNELLRIDVDWREDPGRGWFADLESPEVPARSLLVFSEPGIQIEERRPEDSPGSPRGLRSRRSPEPEQRFAGSGLSAFVLDEGVPRYRVYASVTARRPDQEAIVYAETRESTDLEAIEFRQTETSSVTNRSSVTVELAGPARTVAQLRVQVDGELRGGLGLELEVPAADGSFEWFRPPDQDLRVVDRDGARGEWTIDCPSPRPARRLRLSGSSWPGSDYVRVLSILAIPDRIEFLPDGRTPFRLLYGDPQARERRAPLLRPEVLIDTRIPGRLGPEEPNPFYESPRGFEWLRRHPAVLSGALFAVLAVLAGLALTGRRSRTPAGGSR